MRCEDNVNPARCTGMSPKDMPACSASAYTALSCAKLVHRAFENASAAMPPAAQVQIVPTPSADTKPTTPKYNIDWLANRLVCPHFIASLLLMAVVVPNAKCLATVMCCTRALGCVECAIIVILYAFLYDNKKSVALWCGEGMC